MNDEARITNDERSSNAQMTKWAPKHLLSVIRIFDIHSCFDIRASSFSCDLDLA
jgi:hypothetical protein